MNIVFFGTPFFAAKCLEELLANHFSIKAVVTQPDRPKGRSLKVMPSPVKSLLLEKAPNIPILQPEKASDESFLQTLKKLDADLFVVVAFGQILPQALLDIPSLGCINLHASLLPKYRGAAPIQRCLINGEKQTGVCVQKMVKKLDAGDVIAEEKTAISDDMTFQELEAKLIELSKKLLIKVIQMYQKGIPPAKKQDESLVSYAPKISLAEGEIHWNEPAQKIHNLIRAFSPKPGAWCWVETSSGKVRLKILKSRIVSQDIHREDVISCSEGALKLLEVQPEGKRIMKMEDWMRGQKNISFI